MFNLSKRRTILREGKRFKRLRQRSSHKDENMKEEEAENNSLTNRVSTIKSNLVNFFWHEKFLLLLDSLQVFGLIWICAQPWPWPYLWVTWTRNIVFFNVDIFSLLPDGALAGRTNNKAISMYGEMHGYLYYALAFAIIEIVFILSLVYLNQRTNTYAKSWYKFKPYLTTVGLYLGTILYVPLSLPLLRLYGCDSNSQLSADPSIQCGSSSHVVITIFCSIVHLPVMVLVPYLLYSYTQDSILYDLSPDHEKRLQTWELMYMLNINVEYEERQCWIFSSFKRKAAFYRFNTIILKVLLMLTFIACRSSIVAQAVLCLIFTSLYYFYYGLYQKAYRSITTSLMIGVIAVLIIVDTAFGFANSLKVTNFLMVSSTESITLMAINVVGAAVICLVAIVCLLNPLLMWPPHHTLLNISKSSDKGKACSVWIDLLARSNEIKINFLLSTDELADIDAVEEIIRALRQCWLSAATVGSIFTLSLSEALEELIYIHSLVYPRAMRKRDMWNRSYAEVSADAKFARRHQQYLLMAPRKKRILTKLLAMRTFLEGVKNRDSDIQMMKSSTRPVSRTASSSSKASSGRRKQSIVADFTNPLSNFLEEDRSRIEAERLAQAKEIIAQLTILSDQKIAQHSPQVSENVDMLISAEEYNAVIEIISDWSEIITAYEDMSFPGLRVAYTESDLEQWYAYKVTFSTIADVWYRARQIHGNTFSFNRSYSGSVDYGDEQEAADNDDDDELDVLLGLKAGWNKPKFYSDSAEVV